MNEHQHPHHGAKHGLTRTDPACLHCNVLHARIHPANCGILDRGKICPIHDRATLSIGLIRLTDPTFYPTRPDRTRILQRMFDGYR